MTRLDSTTAIQFNESFLIPIKSDISKLFGTNKIDFQISIKDKKIVIESPRILADMDIQDRHLESEAINVS